ncbi:penicillin acylase family protein [Lichenicoccus sp.]|uniref:penicillin acylase family protein n=1 Tax=Lichenicoccus sp. TaxID=2781899 RepID=UPI003D125FA7
MRRAAVAVAAALSALLLAGLAAIGAGLLLTLPPRTQGLRIPGLEHPVSVRFDAVGIPHIQAASADDAAAGLGFVHARDRMFQMELMRRLGSGRLSEIAGPATLPIDRMMRVLGLRVRAAAAYPTLPAADRALLDAYARGVNAEIAARGRFIAPEFLLLGRPERWTPTDSLLWGRLMALSLGDNWRTELARLAASSKLPLARLLAVRPAPVTAPSPQASLIFPAALTRFAASLDRALPRFPAPYTLPSEASDEWAVDGAHSATGAPLLAGDPHLALGFPAVWYLARIDRPGYQLTGATAPGAPYMVLGQNGHIAWTFTSNEADAQDLFVERPGTQPGTYLTPDGPRAFAVHTEIIHVRGAPDQRLIVRESRHGPLIGDVLPHQHGRLLAAEMTMLMPTTPAHTDVAVGLIALDAATSVAEAQAAAATSTAPVQNLLVADRQSIGLFTTGTVPIRRAGDGAFPQDGADGLHDWTGFASGPSLPHVVAPSSGHLLNGNERTAPPDYPVFMGRDWPDDWRARRIRTLLAARPTHDVAEFASMQNDTVSAFAAAMLPLLAARAAAASPDDFSQRALDLLHGWDGSMRAGAPQPLIFNAWLQRFAADALARNHLNLTITGPWPDFVAFLLSPAGASWCGGDCTPMLMQALASSTARLARQQGNDPANWRWGHTHRAVFDNAFLRAIPIVRRLARRSIPVSGDETTLLRAGGAILGNFDATHGGAYRGVYDLADPDRSRFIVTPGQSGNWVSGEAWNLMRKWASGATMTIPREPPSMSATARLTP